MLQTHIIIYIFVHGILTLIQALPLPLGSADVATSQLEYSSLHRRGGYNPNEKENPRLAMGQKLYRKLVEIQSEYALGIKVSPGEGDKFRELVGPLLNKTPMTDDVYNQIVVEAKDFLDKYEANLCPDKTRLKKTGSKKTGSKKTGLKKKGLKKKGLKKKGLEKTGLEKTGSKKKGLKKTGLEKTGLEKTGLEKTGLEKTGSEKMELEKTGSEKMELNYILNPKE